MDEQQHAGTGEIRVNKLLAQSKVKSVKKTLEDEKYSGSEWDAHKGLVDAAEALANGSGSSMEMQSAAISLLATCVTLDRMREADRIKEAIVKVHDPKYCLNGMVTFRPDGRPVMPWEKDIAGAAAQTSADLSVISGWGWTLKGPVARLALACVVICTVVLGVVYLLLSRQDATLRRDMRETILPTVIQAVKAQVSMAAETNKEGDPNE